MNERTNLFTLRSYLSENGYSEIAITKLLTFLLALMEKQYYQFGEGVVLSVFGVNPYVKINPKSVRVRLYTNGVRDEVIIEHPSNTFAIKNGDVIRVGSHNLFKTPIGDQKGKSKFTDLEKYTICF
jgi:hypothetical protein